MPLFELRLHIGEKWTDEGTRLVASGPEIALERLEIGDLEVFGHQVVDMGAEGFA